MRYGWVILLVSIILGLFVTLLVILSPSTVLAEPALRAGDVQRALRAWGVTWLFFNVIALVILFRGFRQGERWAWWTLWLLPLLWLSNFLIGEAPVLDLVIGIITAVGLILPYRRFFSASDEQTSRVS